jgi:hypothetical protein
MAARFDLAVLADADAVFGVAARTAAMPGDAVVLVVIGGGDADPDRPLPQEQLVADLHDLIILCGKRAVHALWTSALRAGAPWACYDDPATGRLPDPRVHAGRRRQRRGRPEDAGQPGGPGRAADPRPRRRADPPGGADSDRPRRLRAMPACPRRPGETSPCGSPAAIPTRSGERGCGCREPHPRPLTCSFASGGGRA